ncbi:hypothetical protein [Streptomyces bobili]|uniref:RHS repeat protein n=1 Tax=Streptomyces bobili TaxID=67280 RepID=A0ABZ1R7K5_9ACTN|nr:hypothetical protein [Streptomyces bobili]
MVDAPKLASNGQAHKSYNYFDPARSTVTYTLDSNLKRTEHTYDAIGRITATWLSNRSKAGGRRTECEVRLRRRRIRW